MSENLAQSGDIYEQLGASKDTPAREIHRHFLKLVLRLLDKIATSQGNQAEHLQTLQALWFAHDILTDPATRTDYDLRVLGIRTGDSEEVEETSEPGEQTVCSWRIGELMQAAGWLEQAELDIACDMHRAMPEMQFGRFLSKQGFIEEKQVQAVLIGQVLLRNGLITLSQFCAIMSQFKQSQRDIKEIILESGLINQALFKELKLEFN